MDPGWKSPSSETWRRSVDLSSIKAESYLSLLCRAPGQRFASHTLPAIGILKRLDAHFGSGKTCFDIRTAAQTSVLALFLLICSLCGQVSSEAVRAEGGGVAVDIPSGWHWNRRTAGANGPISLATSAGGLSSGGVLPDGMAEIDITSIPSPRNLQETIRRELTGATIESFKEAALGSNPSVIVLFTDDYGKLVLATEAVYVLRGSRVFKFYLTYHSGDSRAKDYRSTFEQLVSHASFGR